MKLCRDCAHKLGIHCGAVGPELDYVTGDERLVPCSQLRDVFGAECPHWKPRVAE
jgi:hypothetical protein